MDFLDLLPAEQRRMRARCRHVSGAFVAFAEDAVESSIPVRFEQMVDLYPERLAAKDGARQMTYRELNRAANVAAHTLLAARGQRAEAVALLFDHGLTMLCAVLGVLKAGRWYVPLSPHDPVARLEGIVGDAGARVILTDAANIELAYRIAGADGVAINLDTIDLSAHAPNPPLEIAPDAFAYVIYTSGSTGTPKGVLEIHRNVLEYTMSYVNDCGVCPEDRSTLLGSLSFSGSLLPMFGTLLSGAALFLFDVRKHGFEALSAWLNAEAISIFICGSFYRLLVTSADHTIRFPSFRLIYCSAEATFARDFEWYKTYCADECVFVVSLGATEVKGIRRFFADNSYLPSNPVMPVGYRIHNVEVFIRGEDGQELPAGSTGEIAVRSRFISRGYFGRPDLTAEKYLPDPADPAQRIYLTGDLGRLDPDCCLHHAGRKDFQVKVRGQRVELLEVEAVISSLPGVKRAAVLAEDGSPGNVCLVAWLAPLPAAGVDAAVIRRALAARLPGYMVPDTIWFLPELPSLTSAKIDRQALRRLASASPQRALTEPYVAPRTPIELGLAGIWQEVLGLERVGIRDNFLDLAGNSLQAAQIVARAQRAFGADLSPNALFQAPTVAEMALGVVEQRAGQLESGALEAMVRDPEDRVVPAIGGVATTTMGSLRSGDFAIG